MGQGQDPHVVTLGCLTPLRGAEARVQAKEDLVEDGPMGMVGRKGIHVHEHPEGHLVGDHVASLLDGLAIIQCGEGDQDAINLVGYA